MADTFADWKAANEAKAKARAKRKAADQLKKERDEAWEEYSEQYGNYKKFATLRPEDIEKWRDWLKDFSDRWNKAADDWFKAEQEANQAEMDAVKAVKKFNDQLPPDVPLMPMDF